MIHPTAIVDPKARIETSVKIGPHAVIGPEVEIGEGTVVDHHTFIEGHTRVGKNVRIHPYAALGGVPQDLKYDGEPCYLEIDDRTEIREFVTINAGTGNGPKTRLGKDCLLMAYSHVGHNTILGDGIVMANVATLAGHVVVDDFAIIGGLVGVHQFVRIGKMVMVGGCSKVVKDLPPYMLADGNPATIRSINKIGLKRKGVDDSVITAIKESFKALYKSGCNITNSVRKLRDIPDPCTELREILDFIEQSQRGIARGER
jgi:UDP-N-acetylglucosamine acyltransferase